MSSYSLATGSQGANRLEILNAAMWPSTHRLLQEAGLQPGMSFLDVGCGTGAVSVCVADLGVQVLGIDADEGFIKAAQARRSQARFQQLNALDIPLLGQFDIVYARYLLSHLPEPLTALKAMVQATNPGGRVVLEDIDFDLHVAEPRPKAFDRYLELYREVVKRRGGDPVLGRKLYALAQEAGLVDVQPRVQVTIARGEARHLTTLTLAGIKQSVVQDGLAGEQEVDDLLGELQDLEQDNRSLISVAGTHQVWGVKGS